MTVVFLEKMTTREGIFTRIKQGNGFILPEGKLKSIKTGEKRKMKSEIKPKYIICDLDGCLIDSAWIWDVIRALNVSKDEGFDIFNRLANADKNKIDLSLYKFLCFKGSGGFKIHFLTARSELIEVETINFIQKKRGHIWA